MSDELTRLRKKLFELVRYYEEMTGQGESPTQEDLTRMMTRIHAVETDYNIRTQHQSSLLHDKTKSAELEAHQAHKECAKEMVFLRRNELEDLALARRNEQTDLAAYQERVYKETQRHHAALERSYTRMALALESACEAVWAMKRKKE